MMVILGCLVAFGASAGVANYLAAKAAGPIGGHSSGVLGDGGGLRHSTREQQTAQRSSPSSSSQDDFKLGSLVNISQMLGKTDATVMPEGDPPSVLPHGEEGFCSSTAELTEATRPHTWRLDASWQSVCANKWFSDKEHANDYPQRNWCWVGFKSECHWNLKSHRPWKRFQEKAGNLGSTVPREIGPFDPVLNPELCDKPEAGKARNFTSKEVSESRKWFNKNVNVFVLNLDKDKKRWDSIAARLKSLNITAKRVPGVDMRRPGRLIAAKEQGWVPHGYNFTAAQEASYSYKQQMGSVLGTLGCASGHFKAQDVAIASGKPLAIVFEDDVWPEKDFVERIWELVTQEVPCDWNVVSLYSRCPYGKCVSRHLTRVERDDNEPAWGCHHGVNWGMQGVLYRIDTLKSVQELWKPVVFDENRPHCMDIDVALASISHKVGYYAVPSVQDPGFLHEMDQGSARWDINMDASSVESKDSTAADAAGGDELLAA
jgi:GR25 family glycosyltransferase involved in LPS biosynthesis